MPQRASRNRSCYFLYAGTHGISKTCSDSSRTSETMKVTIAQGQSSCTCVCHLLILLETSVLNSRSETFSCSSVSMPASSNTSFSFMFIPSAMVPLHWQVLSPIHHQAGGTSPCDRTHEITRETEKCAKAERRRLYQTSLNIRFLFCHASTYLHSICRRHVVVQLLLGIDKHAQNRNTLPEAEGTYLTLFTPS